MDVLWQEFVDWFSLVCLMGAGIHDYTGDPGVLGFIHDLVKSFLRWGILTGFVLRPWQLRTDEVETAVHQCGHLSVR